MRKTSVYLEDAQAERLAAIAERENRSQAEVLRDAITAYESPAAADRRFEVSAGFSRLDGGPPISEIPESELLEGFGA